MGIRSLLQSFLKFWRFDDLIRSERYFTATLLPLLLFHNNLEGVRRFVELVDRNTATEHNGIGEQVPKNIQKYDFEDVEVITEFHIARDLEAASLRPDDNYVELSEENERERRDAPDVVVIAGEEILVCEAKFFTFFSDSDVDDLNTQLRSQRLQVKHLFQNRQLRPIRAYRHVAIVPFDPNPRIDADVVITWIDIRDLAEQFLGPNHYVTARLRNAVERYKRERGCPAIPGFDGKLSFEEMREKCRTLGDEIQVGHVGGEAALFAMSLPEAEKKQWKWRKLENNGAIVTRNWLGGTHWLDIVECRRGFGRKKYASDC